MHRRDTLYKTMQDDRRNVTNYVCGKVGMCSWRGDCVLGGETVLETVFLEGTTPRDPR